MDLKIIHDRQALAEYFRQDISLHSYSLGDLDDFYWPYVTCIGRDTPAGIDDVSVLYQGEGLPVLLSFTRSGKMDQDYFSQLSLLLPDQFYAHFSPGLEIYFSGTHAVEDYGNHYKMELQNPALNQIEGIEKIFRLTENDLPEMIGLFENSYPGNAFDPRMVLTEQYFGYRESGNLVSVGGVHVYSEQFKVAALGNITTHPNFRNRGLGRIVTTRICISLIDKVDFVGLNVKAANSTAVNLYQSLGFTISDKYGEFSLKKPKNPHFSPKNQ